MSDHEKPSLIVKKHVFDYVFTKEVDGWYVSYCNLSLRYETVSRWLVPYTTPEYLGGLEPPWGY
jgi:hypothetical protein